MMPILPESSRSDLPPPGATGGGPAGPTAAIYLGRFRRRFLVADASSSRASWSPKSLNQAGCPDGISGGELVSRMQTQAIKYGIEIARGGISDFRQLPDGTFEAVLQVSSIKHVVQIDSSARFAGAKSPASYTFDLPLRIVSVELAPSC